MDILILIVIGLLAGLVAKFIMPGRDPGGIIVTTLLGIAGSLLAGWLGPQVGIYAEGGFGKFIAAVVGAIIILIIYRLAVRRPA